MVWPFTTEKKPRKQLNPAIEEHREAPFVAHIERDAPKDARQRLILGKLGTIEDLHSAQELEEAVRPRWGGGHYKTVLYDQANRGDGYMGVYNFTLPGEPLMDGKPVEMPEKEEKSRKGKVAELEQKKAEMKAARELEREKAEWEKEKAEWEKGGGAKDAQLTALREEMERNRAEAAERDEEREEEYARQTADRDAREREKEERAERERRDDKFAEALRQQQEKSDERFEALLAEIKGSQGESAQVSQFQVLSKALESSAKMQMEGTKQIVENMRDQMKTMMTGLTAPSPAIAEAANTRKEMLDMYRTQLEQSRDNKESSVDRAIQLLAVLKDFAAEQSGDPGDKWPDTVRDSITALGAAIAKFAERPKQLAAPDKAEIEAQANSIGRKMIHDEVAAARARLKPTTTAPVEASTTEPVSVEEAEPPGELPPEPASRTPALETPTDPDVIERRSLVITELLKILETEMKEQPNTATWPQFAFEHLPKEMLAVLQGAQGPGDLEAVLGMFKDYVDETRVAHMVEVAQKDPAAGIWLLESFGAFKRMSEQPG